MRKKCSSDQEKCLKFEAEDREFENFLRSLELFVRNGQNNFWQQSAFLTCFWRFLRSNKLEQFEFKLGFRNMQEKLENISYGRHMYHLIK